MSDSQTNQDLVVVGASAGGIEALSQFVATLSPDFPAPIVIAQHLEPSRVSHLGEILRRPLRRVGWSTSTRPSALGSSTSPPNRDVEITDHAISLSSDQPDRPALD